MLISQLTCPLQLHPLRLTDVGDGSVNPVVKVVRATLPHRGCLSLTRLYISKAFVTHTGVHYYLHHDHSSFPSSNTRLPLYLIIFYCEFLAASLHLFLLIFHSSPCFAQAIVHRLLALRS